MGQKNETSKKNKILKANQNKATGKASHISFYAIGEKKVDGEMKRFVNEVTTRFRHEAIALFQEWATVNKLELSFVGTFK